MPEQNGASEKKPYRKPDVEKVALRPEEAVLGACKTGAGGVSGPGQGRCNAPAPCSAMGS